MGGRKLKALLAQGRSGWANGTIASRDRKVFLFDNYLIGCPVPGSSFAGRTCEAFSRVDNSMAKELLDKCLDGIPGNSVFCHAELRMVARWLIDNRREGATVPSGSHEYVCMAESKPGILKDHYGLFANIEKKQISAKDWRPYMSLLAVDAFFRHIRNSIAHGSFTEVRRKKGDNGKKEPFLYLQDTNAQHQISARMYLSYERLERIADDVGWVAKGNK